MVMEVPTTFDREEYLAWVRKTFPNETIFQRARHLHEELEELQRSPQDPMEMADCYMLVIGIQDQLRETEEDLRAVAALAHVDLEQAAAQKFAICRQSKWVEGPTGYHRIKPTENATA